MLRFGGECLDVDATSFNEFYEDSSFSVFGIDGSPRFFEREARSTIASDGGAQTLDAPVFLQRWANWYEDLSKESRILEIGRGGGGHYRSLEGHELGLKPESSYKPDLNGPHTARFPSSAVHVRRLGGYRGWNSVAVDDWRIGSFQVYMTRYFLGFEGDPIYGLPLRSNLLNETIVVLDNPINCPSLVKPCPCSTRELPCPCSAEPQGPGLPLPVPCICFNSEGTCP